ncbi:hypothetical protein B7494_g5309 [Chlorociboria aeruginascens]|nr:hypothetical protein B7494_g5309 [Chlorociboria aeruginascens]
MVAISKTDDLGRASSSLALGVPLILTAHDHARAASVATQSSDTTVAINEHTLAAGEFAKAATGTGSTEALRTLRLLEQHHQRLSALLRYPSENPVAAATAELEVQGVEKPLSTSAAVAELRASKSDLGPRSSSPLRTPSLHTPRRLPPRDPSSSIASNLASARGIRSNYARQPLSPSVSIQQAPGNLEVLPRRGRTKVVGIPEHVPPKPVWTPPQPNQRKSGPQTATSRASAVAEPHVNDEGFSKFYNAFESILHKLSAPLAFAGLPLISEDDSAPTPAPEAAVKRPRSKGKEKIETDPDLTKYISRAALRATARDGHSGNDSFYVVPTTGHTVSYANILSFAEKEKRRLAASMHSENPDLFPEPNDEDDFVDAREMPMPVSPELPKNFRASRKETGRDLENKVEELDLENRSLKACVDELSKRLHTFELSAQNSSMALQESMRLMRSVSPARDQSRGPSEDEALKRRVLELEDQMRFRGKELDRLEKENEKLKTVVGRYRERWEKLKEGAKTRREGTGKDAGKETLPNKDMGD